MTVNNGHSVSTSAVPVELSAPSTSGISGLPGPAKRSGNSSSAEVSNWSSMKRSSHPSQSQQPSKKHRNTTDLDTPSTSADSNHPSTELTP